MIILEYFYLFVHNKKYQKCHLVNGTLQGRTIFDMEICTSLLTGNYCRPWWLSRMLIHLMIRRLWVWSLQGPATVFPRDWAWKIFYGFSLSSPDSRRTVVSFRWKNMHKYWLTGLRGFSIPRKSVLRLANMSLMGWLGSKTLTQKSVNTYKLNRTILFIVYVVQSFEYYSYKRLTLM